METKPVHPTHVGYAKRLAELHAASRAIGGTARSRLGWAVRFARAEPGRGVKHEGDGLWALAGHGLPPNLVGGVRLPPHVPKQEIEAIRRRLRDALENAVGRSGSAGAPGSSPTVFHRPEDGALQFIVYRLTDPTKKPARWGWSYWSPTLAGAVSFAVGHLITQAGDRLVACRLCGAPIVSIRKQQFCDTTEAQTFRNDKKAKARLTPKLTPKKTDIAGLARRARKTVERNQARLPTLVRARPVR